VGLKTSIGRWPVDGIVPLSSTFDTPGLLTRSVADAAVAFAAVDRTCAGVDAMMARAEGLSVAGLRLGICDEHFWDNCSPGVAEGVRAALDELVARGARLVRLSLPEATEARTRFVRGALFGVEGLSYIGEEYPDRLDTIDPNIGARFDVARKVSAVDYFHEKRKIAELAAMADEKLRSVDALVTPTVPMTPPTVAEVADPAVYGNANGLMTQNTQPVNLLAQCAVTMPVALDAAGMPVGLQLVGRNGDDERLIAVALACERALGTARERLGVPPLCRK
jgi:aspartyl-tRNA(Asn)/glutamyl-tRNA(Gln) amidotransferase subunit A